MAFNFNLPTLASNYSTVFVPTIQDGWKALGSMLDPAYAGTLTNIPVGAKRVNAGLFQEWNGSAWGTYDLIYAPKNSPAFTGLPTTTDVPVDNSSDRVVNSRYVLNQLSVQVPLMDGSADAGSTYRFARGDHRHPTDTTRAPSNNPSLSGTPTAPTAAQDTNTTQLATTAFVLNQWSSTLPLADGAASVGASARFARSDHRHPTDGTRAPLEGPALTGYGTYNGLELGWRRIPLNTSTGAYTLVASDSAKCVVRDGNVTIPSGVFAPEDSLLVLNNRVTAGTLIAGGGTTVILAGIGSTGNRTMGPYALVSILCIASNVFVVSGAGLT